MPPLPPVTGLVKIAHQFTSGTRIFGLSYHVWNGGVSVPAADVNTLATAARSAWGVNFPAKMTASVVMSRTTAQDLSSATGATGTDNTQVPGTAATGQLPLGTAVVMNLQLARHYRGGKPKIFLPIGLNGDLATPFTWSSTSVAAFNSDFTTYQTAIQSAATSVPYILCNVSYYSGFTSVQNPVTHRYRNVPTRRVTPLVDLITGHSARVGLGSQRRRTNPS